MLDGVRSGLTNAEIAERLGISVNTVRYHVSNMLTKVGVTDRQALAAWDGVPVPGVRFTRGGLLALARFLGLAAALVVAAALAWFALDRLSGVISEVPAGMPEASATPSEVTPAATVDPLAGNVSFASSGRLWARGLQAPSTSNGLPAVAVAEDGSIVIAMTISYFEAPPGEYEVDVGGGPEPVGGSYDGVVARYDASGAFQWSRLLASVGDEGIGDVAVTPDGAILVSGMYGDGADLGRGSEPAADERDIFLARYRSDGSPDWLHTYGGIGRDQGGQLELFDDGDIAWSGSFEGSGTIGEFSVDGGVPYPRFLARLSPEGDPRWVTSIEGLGVLTLDRSSSGVLFGYNNASSVSPPETREFGIGALSPEGEPVWRLPFAGSGHASVRDIEVLPDGSAFAVGRFSEPTDFGGGTIDPVGCCHEYVNENMVSDAFALRVSDEGSLIWSKHWGGSLLDDASTVTLEAGGTVLVGGTLYSTVEVQGLDGALPTISATGTWNPEPEGRAYVARFTLDGEATNIMYVDEAGRVDRLGPIILDSAATEDGEMLIGGRYFTSVTFPFGGRIANSEWLDYFIARIEAP